MKPTSMVLEKFTQKSRSCAPILCHSRLIISLVTNLQLLSGLIWCLIGTSLCALDYKSRSNDWLYLELKAASNLPLESSVVAGHASEEPL